MHFSYMSNWTLWHLSCTWWHCARITQRSLVWVGTLGTPGTKAWILLNLDSQCLIQHYRSSLSGGQGEISQAWWHCAESRHFPPSCVFPWMSLPNLFLNLPKGLRKKLSFQKWGGDSTRNPMNSFRLSHKFCRGQEQMDSKEWGDYGPTQGYTRTEHQVIEHSE